MRAEVQLYEKSGTISFNLMKNTISEIRIYKKLKKDNLWFLILQKLNFSTHFPLEFWDQFG